jgi:nucleotide-binding universal stress UspA family protein
MGAELDNPIVVGVDGSDDGLRAVRYAARAAHESGCGLRLVHVLPETVPMTPMLPLISGERLSEVGSRIIRQAMNELSGQDGVEGVETEQVVRAGSRVHVLAEEADRGRLIVLGHRGRSALGRLFTASTTTGVATRAHRPVMCVPTTWAPETERRHVVVGVDDPGRAGDLLSTAFAIAAARRARLTVVHAWRLQSPYDDIIASRVDQTPWQGVVKERLGELVRALEAEYPGVEADVDVRHEPPAAALMESSRDADLLILGRHGHGAPFGFYLGPIARAMIWEAECPVQITPAQVSGDHSRNPADDQSLATAGSGDRSDGGRP